MDTPIFTNRPAAAGEVRERILHAAFHAFSEHGFAGTSTLEIAKRAKVSKRDLYAHFGSKQGILEACVTERTQRMRAALQFSTPLARAAFIALLTRFGGAVVREVSRPEVITVYRLAIAEAERSPHMALTLDTAGRGSATAELAGLLVQAQADGLIGDADPEDMVARFMGLLWDNLLTRLLLGVTPAPDEAAIETRARLASDAFMALYPPAGPRPCGLHDLAGS